MAIDTGGAMILSIVISTYYDDVIISAMVYRITSLCSNVYSGIDQRKNQSFASLAFVRGIRRWPVNSPHKGPVTRKMFPLDDVIMNGEWSFGITDLNVYNHPVKFSLIRICKPCKVGVCFGNAFSYNVRNTISLYSYLLSWSVLHCIR